MIVRVTMKNPDALDDALNGGAEMGLSHADAKWIASHFEFREYVTIAFDTEARTVTVEKR